MGLTDYIVEKAVNKAIDKAEDKVFDAGDSKMEGKKGQKKAGCLSEFLAYLIAVVVGLISLALVILGVLGGNNTLAFIGIALSVIFALVVFFTPYLRRNSYIRWLAWLALGDAAWWTYTLLGGN